jgi:prepilin signal peptidase PulO-like enzyme (type II secretory pathway)
MPHFLSLGAIFFGGALPWIARRFAKVMPATLGDALVDLLHFRKFPKDLWSHKLVRKLAAHSVVVALVTLALTVAVGMHFADNVTGWMTAYVWILLLSAEIDGRSGFLPDMLTVPLLILGFGASVFGGGLVCPFVSAVGALVGYGLPVLASLLIAWYKKDAFGGGDIKLLAALGAWLGAEGVLYVVVTASILGMLYALCRSQKQLVFGPMLALAGVVVAFGLF